MFEFEITKRENLYGARTAPACVDSARTFIYSRRVLLLLPLLLLLLPPQPPPSSRAVPSKREREREKREQRLAEGRGEDPLYRLVFVLSNLPVLMLQPVFGG